MPKANTVETYYEDEQWKVKVGENASPSGAYDTKAEAVEEGKKLAKQLGYEHVIKKKDGTIGSKDSYGKDPYPPEG
jgi:hypothetical protein